MPALESQRSRAPPRADPSSRSRVSPPRRSDDADPTQKSKSNSNPIRTTPPRSSDPRRRLASALDPRDVSATPSSRRLVASPRRRVVASRAAVRDRTGAPRAIGRPIDRSTDRSIDRRARTSRRGSRRARRNRRRAADGSVRVNAAPRRDRARERDARERANAMAAPMVRMPDGRLIVRVATATARTTRRATREETRSERARAMARDGG